MRNRKFACGMLALCLALSMAGCGKNSEEQQAANYYQNELGLDRDEAEDLAHYLYGEEDDEEEPSVSEEAPREIVIEPLPELVNSEWYDRKVQLLDMVFPLDEYLTEEVVRKIAEGSAYDIEIVEDFDENGNIRLTGMTLDGEYIALLSKCYLPSGYASLGLFEARYYYYDFYPAVIAKNYFYDKEVMEVESLGFKTRDDVLAYLAENSFVEVEEKQAPYANLNGYRDVEPDEEGAEFADVPHYYNKGVQNIVFFRVHKLNETEQEIEYSFKKYSGYHLNLYECVFIEFNTDGTISSIFPSTGTCLILGEQQ